MKRRVVYFMVIMALALACPVIVHAQEVPPKLQQYLNEAAKAIYHEYREAGYSRKDAKAKTKKDVDDAAQQAGVDTGGDSDNK